MRHDKKHRSIVIGCLVIVTALLADAPAQAVELLASTLDNRVVRIDSFTGAILASYDLPAEAGPPSLIAGLTMARGDRELWYTNAGPGDPLVRLDPMTGSPLGTAAAANQFRGGLSQQSNANGTEAVFVLEDGSPVLRYEGLEGPSSQFIFESPAFPGALGGDDHGRHFVATASDEIVEFEPITGAQIQVFSLGLDGSDYTGLAYDGNRIYLTFDGGTALATLDPDAGTVLHTVQVSDGVVVTGLASQAAIPEPATTALGLLGLTGVGVTIGRRRSV